jgi:hypothetical protein
VIVKIDGILAMAVVPASSADTHRELVRRNWFDMVRLVNPLIAQLTHARPAVVAA